MSNFIISLDFELMWGLRDHHTTTSYGQNIIGVRDAIPRILELFSDHQIGATWATVGLLFCETKDEIIFRSKAILQPQYEDPKLSNYSYFDEIGDNESKDKYYFGKSLIAEILNTPRQKIGTHTFSHYYCLEPGASAASFEADIDLALAIGRENGIDIKSIVFPRNQYEPVVLEICRSRGILSYRGNPTGYAYEAHNGQQNTKLKRALRLVDAHTGILNSQVVRSEINTGDFMNLPATRFLRPNAGKLAKLHSLHLRTIKKEMRFAAKNGSDFHLWWHPHNFGCNTLENISALREIIMEFTRLRDQYGFKSSAMEDISQ